MHDGSSLRTSALRVAALTRHNLLLRRRDPSNLITYMIMPMILIALFKPVLTRLMPDGGTAQDVTGQLVLSSTLALQIAGMSLLSERTWRTWEMLWATPATAAELLIGKAVPVLAVLLLQQAVVIGYGVGVARPERDRAAVPPAARDAGVEHDAAGGRVTARHPGTQP